MSIINKYNQFRPIPPTNLRLFSATTNSLTISFTSTGNYIYNAMVSLDLSASSTNSPIIISNLQPNSEYTVTITSNQNGILSTPSISINVSTGGLLYFSFEDNITTNLFNRDKNGTLSSADSISNIVYKFGSYSMQGKNDSGTDRYIALSNLTIVLNDGLSICFWIKLTNFRTLGDSKLWELSHNEGIFMWQSKSSYVCKFSNSKNSVTLIQNDWTHIVYTISVTGYINVYKNGVLSIDNENVGTSYYPPTTTMGGRIGRSISSSHLSLHGYIDEFRIYNTIFSSSKVTTLYNATF
jgi:hypothetical protein